MKVHTGPADCPAVLPVFPLAGALLLPRGQLPLNIFEPRYLAMVDAALAGDRFIGMAQPDGDGDPPTLRGVGCAGRITQFSETGDGRYLIVLTGVARFKIAGEIAVDTPFRQVRADFGAFPDDFKPGFGEKSVDRDAVLAALDRFAKARDVKVDWDGIREASNEILVNALSMMAPFGPREKQALLEATSLKSRAELLVAISDFELARAAGGGNTLQ